MLGFPLEAHTVSGMGEDRDERRPGREAGAAFATTRWSVVLSARDRTASESKEALEILCSSYWFPIYAFLRRRGLPPADAEDLVQGFFASLFEHDSLAGVSPERGRFRSFLLASLRNHLADQHDRATALKRGGGRAPGLPRGGHRRGAVRP